MWGWGQLCILFMDMIVTFLYHQSKLKSVNLYIMLMVSQFAYINEGAGAINMLINKGRGSLICKLCQNPCFATTLHYKRLNKIIIPSWRL